VNAKDKYSNTPLGLTAAKGEVELVHFLLDQGSLVNEVDQDGRTALWHAAIASWTDITQVSTSRVFLHLMTLIRLNLILLWQPWIIIRPWKSSTHIAC